MASTGTTPSPWNRLWGLLSLEARDLQIVVSYALAIGLLSLATPIAVQTLIGFVAFGGLLQPIVVLSLMLFAVLTFVAALKGAQTLVVEMISRRIFLRTAARVANRVVKPGGGNNLVKLTNRFFDVVTVEKASAVLLFDGIAVVLQIVTGMALLAVYHPLLLAFDLFVLTVVGLIVLVPGRSAVRTALEESTAKYDMADWLEELALHPAVFHSSRGGRVADRMTRARMDGWLDARKRHFHRVFLQTVGFLGMQVFVMTTLLGLGGWLVVQRELAVGQLVAAELVMAATAASVARLGKLLQKSYDVLAALSKIASVTDGPEDDDATETLPRNDGGLAIKVQSQRAGFLVDANQKVRLTGREGTGKTRLLEAVAWLCDDGCLVELDGVDARMLDRRATSDLIHLLGDGGLVEATVTDNLRVARPEATAHELVEVLERVGLKEAVLALPEGLETKLSSDGAPLSGTQAKRLCVARVLLARPRLVLVDRFFDDLPDAPLALFADLLLADDAPWTAVCVSEDPRVSVHFSHEVCLDELNGGVACAEVIG